MRTILTKNENHCQTEHPGKFGCLSTPASFGPSPRRQLAALAGAWLAALASAQSSRPWGRSPGASLRSEDRVASLPPLPLRTCLARRASAPSVSRRSLRRSRHGHGADRRAPRCARKSRVAALPPGSCGTKPRRACLPGFAESTHGLVYPGELRPQSATTARCARRRLARCARFGAVVTAMGSIAGRALRATNRVAALPPFLAAWSGRAGLASLGVRCSFTLTCHNCRVRRTAAVSAAAVAGSVLAG